MSCEAVLSDPTCSNRGVCIGNNTCDCDDGWSGVGDFTLGSPSCSVYTLASQILWGIEAANTLGFQLPIVAYALYRKKQGVFLAGTLNAICLGLVGLLRATRPTNTVGNDPVVTSIFFVAFTIAIGFGWQFTTLFLQVNVRLMGLDAKFKSHMLAFRTALPILLFLVWLTGPLVYMLMLATSDPNVRYYLNTTFFIGNGVSCFVLFWGIIIFALDPLVLQIRDSSKHKSSSPVKKNEEKDLERTASKILLFRLLLKAQGTMLLFVGFIFGLVPVLNRAGPSYHQPLIMTSWAWVVVAFTVALLPLSDMQAAPPGLRFFLIFMGDLMGTNTSNEGAEKSATISPSGIASQSHGKSVANQNQGTASPASGVGSSSG